MFCVAESLKFQLKDKIRNNLNSQFNSLIDFIRPLCHSLYDKNISINISLTKKNPFSFASGATSYFTDQMLIVLEYVIGKMGFIS